MQLSYSLKDNPKYAHIKYTFKTQYLLSYNKLMDLKNYTR